MDERRDVVAPGCERPRQLGGVDEHSLQAALVAGQLTEQAPGCEQEGVEVFEPPVGLCADSVVGDLEAPDHLLQVADRPVVEGVEELVELDGGLGVGEADRPVVGNLLARLVARGEREIDLAVRDPRERDGSDPRRGAARQRRVLVRDREGDERRLPRAERDLLDRSDRRPGDGDLLAADELARVLEFRGDRVLVTAGQEEDRDRKHRDDQSADRGGPPYGTDPAIPSAGR